MSEYYAVQRSDNSLSHYGIKGMKWGVRKAVEKGNIRKLRKHYAKAVKKLNKLNKMSISGKKYAARAAAYGTGAATVGGLALAGTGGVANLITRRANRLASSVKYSTKNAVKVASAADAKKLMQSKELKKAAENLTNFGNSKSIANAVNSAKNSVKTKLPSGAANAQNIIRSNQPIGNLNGHLPGPATTLTERMKADVAKAQKAKKYPSNNALIRAGLGAAAVGLGAAAARNVYKAKHGQKYRQKAIAFQKAMDEAFSGIDYSKLQSKKKRRRSR